MHVTGYPVWHGVFLHFLQGKHLQCSSKYWDQIWKIHPTNILLYKQNAVLGIRSRSHFFYQCRWKIYHRTYVQWLWPCLRFFACLPSHLAPSWFNNTVGTVKTVELPIWPKLFWDCPKYIGLCQNYFGNCSKGNVKCNFNNKMIFGNFLIKTYFLEDCFSTYFSKSCKTVLLFTFFVG